ncbi:MAG: FecR family protein [Candidatus Sulfopaludibacter sp.]|nr:FecR family protein [Candidatus Sulfopaludibacter sp.]
MIRLTLLLIPAALFAGQVRYARLGEFSGPVEVQLHPADEWMPAERNLPLPESAWVRTGAGARVEMELDDGSVCRLGPDSQGGFSDYTLLSTGQRVTLISLDHGVAYFTGRPQGKDALTLAAPGMQVILVKKARIRLEAETAWTRLSILEGSARFSSPTAEIDLVQGQYTRVEPDNPARFVLDRGIAEMALDRWNAERDKALASPVSAGHVAERYGVADLDAAGQWIETGAYGAVWQPKTPAGWVPYQNGRWRWYDAMGYTWVSDDAWGWLPFHYGRWTRTSDLGWIWAPSVSQVFKPGDVYWMRGSKIAGWGPLAPGEEWDPPSQPQEFLNVHTTWAAFSPEARTIDPAGFKDRPKEALTAAVFLSSLPSPAFVTARLDAVRPVVKAGSTRIVPSLQGVSFQDFGDPPPPPPAIVITPAPPPPIVVINNPPADPEQVAVPYAVPYPVLAGTFSMTTSGGPKRQPPQPKTSAPAPSSPPPPQSAGRGGTNPGKPQPPILKPKRPRDDGERASYNQVLKDASDPAKQLVDLDNWSRRYRDSDYEDERRVLYMQVFSKLNHPDKVVEEGARLLAKGLERTFPDPADGPTEILNVLYLTTVSGQLLDNPHKPEAATITAAARRLREYLPAFFAPERKPANLSAENWQQARTFMDDAAKKTLATAAHWSPTN